MERIVSVENEVHVTLGSNHSTKLLAFKRTNRVRHRACRDFI